MTKVKVFKKVKDQRVKVMISNEKSCQKEYVCEIWKPASTNQSNVVTKIKVCWWMDSDYQGTPAYGGALIKYQNYILMR
jgi:hypothetical protein